MAHSTFADRSIHEMLQGKTGSASESDEGLHHGGVDTCQSVPFRAVAIENSNSRNHTGKINLPVYLSMHVLLECAICINLYCKRF